MNEDLIYRLRTRAEIRRQIPGRKSVEEGTPDRIANLLDEAADALEAVFTAYNEKHDAHFNPITDVWLEVECGDPLCSYCNTRPERPSQA